MPSIWFEVYSIYREVITHRERYTPPKPTETLGALGLLIGGTTGVSKYKNIPERIANMVTGSIAGLLLGTLLGALLETLIRTEREVIYE